VDPALRGKEHKPHDATGEAYGKQRVSNKNDAQGVWRTYPPKNCGAGCPVLPQKRPGDEQFLVWAGRREPRPLTPSMLQPRPRSQKSAQLPRGAPRTAVENGGKDSLDSDLRLPPVLGSPLKDQSGGS